MLRENTTLPVYLVNAAPGVEVEKPGIPYCRGGYHPKDVFEERLTLIFDDGNVDELYMTGNIHTGYYKRGTIGLDCGRFLCAAFEFTSGLHPDDILDYGHRVSSISQLSEMDVIVKGSYYGAHAMFYKGISENETVKVYETSSSALVGRTMERDTGYNGDQLDGQGYKFLHVYFELDYDSSQHWVQCKSCTDYRITEPHTMELSESGHYQKCTGCDYMVVVTQHTFTYTNSSGGHVGICNECGYVSETLPHAFTYAYSNTVHVGTCSECGYRISGTHNMTVSPGDAGGHIYSCVCGKTTTQAHTFTYSTYSIIKHRQTCSKCGYSELAPHLLSYSYDADGHWQECSLCSFETVSQAHNFVDSECTVCGCPQHIIMNIIAIPEEDEPLPVPEDQKATL